MGWKSLGSHTAADWTLLLPGHSPLPAWGSLGAGGPSPKSISGCCCWDLASPESLVCTNPALLCQVGEGGLENQPGT